MSGKTTGKSTQKCLTQGWGFKSLAGLDILRDSVFSRVSSLKNQKLFLKPHTGENAPSGTNGLPGGQSLHPCTDDQGIAHKQVEKKDVRSRPMYRPRI